MPERTYTAHVELSDGKYHSFVVTAASLKAAYAAAQSRTAPEHILQGVTEREPVVGGIEYHGPSYADGD